MQYMMQICNNEILNMNLVERNTQDVRSKCFKVKDG